MIDSCQMHVPLHSDPKRNLPVILRATGAIDNPEYWPLGNVSDDGSCYSKANLSISVISGAFNSGFCPLGQAGPR